MSSVKMVTIYCSPPRNNATEIFQRKKREWTEQSATDRGHISCRLYGDFPEKERESGQSRAPQTEATSVSFT